MKLPRVMAIFLLVLVLAMLAFIQPVKGVQQAGLDRGGDAKEVNHDSLGYLYVSDAIPGKIWQIRASDGSFETYSLGHKVRDAQMDNNNRIWWVNDSDSFGYVTPGSPVTTRWTLTSGPNNFIQTLVPDGLGGVWLGEYDDPGRLFHFNPYDKLLCQYNLPGRAYTHDLVYQSGYLWLGNWKTAQFYRILPDYGSNSISYVYWQEDHSGGAWGIDFDGKYLWWADFLLKAIGRLDPNQDQATYYHLPVGDQPVMVELYKGLVWYTEQFGQVGMLDPALATGENVGLSWDSGSAVGNCTTLGIPAYPTAQISTGALSWNDSPVSKIYNADGWKISKLPDASPFGLGAAAGKVWVSDYGKNLLWRIEAETLSPIYLPVIRQK